MIKETKIFISENNLQEAFDFISEYFENYNPAGYGTQAKIYLDVKGLIVEIERYNSCD